jgi:hypothetical protein
MNLNFVSHNAFVNACNTTTQWRARGAKVREIQDWRIQNL